jgi:hypothetical protein
MHFTEIIEVKQNLRLTTRERGKIVDRREGHNIWLNLGREYLAKLISYKTFIPPVFEEDARIRYMGLGIGGTRQLAVGIQPGSANVAPLTPAYAGTNTQTDVDPTVTTLERPVRLSGSSTNYPGLAGDTWLGQIQAPADHSIPTQVTFRRVFSEIELNYPPFLSVPLSEIGLLTSASVPNFYKNTLVAYDTFDSLSKTSAFSLEVDWTIRF